jgi:hypothetical protein
VHSIAYQRGRWNLRFRTARAARRSVAIVCLGLSAPVLAGAQFRPWVAAQGSTITRPIPPTPGPVTQACPELFDLDYYETPGQGPVEVSGSCLLGSQYARATFGGELHAASNIVLSRNGAYGYTFEPRQALVGTAAASLYTSLLGPVGYSFTNAHQYAFDLAIDGTLFSDLSPRYTGLESMPLALLRLQPQRAGAGSVDVDAQVTFLLDTLWVGANASWTGVHHLDITQLTGEATLAGTVRLFVPGTQLAAAQGAFVLQLIAGTHLQNPSYSFSREVWDVFTSANFANTARLVAVQALDAQGNDVTPAGGFRLATGEVLPAAPGDGSVVPEPASVVLTATGLVGLWAAARRGRAAPDDA